MPVLGKVISIVRYPVKSMAGETLDGAYLTAHGLEHDRLYAFESSGAPPGMLRLTGRERRAMLQYHPCVRPDGEVDVLTPGGERFAVDSPALLASLQTHIVEASRLSLTHESTPQTDVRPLSLLSVQTVNALSAEFGTPLGSRRFRANLLLQLDGGAYAEELLAGQIMEIGSQVKVFILERIPRCRFITYDPEAPLAVEPLIPLMKLLERQHAGRTGVYASVLTPGWIQTGDSLYI